jgi:hypothetical protein
VRRQDAERSNYGTRIHVIPVISVQTEITDVTG